MLFFLHTNEENRWFDTRESDFGCEKLKNSKIQKFKNSKNQKKKTITRRVRVTAEMSVLRDDGT